MNREEVFGLTFPLLMDSQGKKFGKTAGGAVWLNPERTSIFDYYQFWRNCNDADVEKLLLFFTDIPVSEVAELAKLEAPMINRAKEILAYEATKLAHGADEAKKAYLGAGSKFGFADLELKIKTSSDIVNIKVEPQQSVAKELPTFEIDSSEFVDGGIGFLSLMSKAGLVASNGEARRLVTGGGAYLNEERVSDPKLTISISDFSADGLVLRAGKKKIKRIILK
jgi:tyrosyl-tRNA synthetase